MATTEASGQQSKQNGFARALHGQHGPQLPDELPVWGQPVSAERQAELQSALDAWNTPNTDHSKRKGPFDGVPLTGADVFWLAVTSRHDEFGGVPQLHLEGAILGWVQLAGTDLRGAHLEHAYLFAAYLAGADLRGTHLEGADLFAAHLEGADLRGAFLDSKTSLNASVLDRKSQLGDIQWGGVGTVNLTQIAWNEIPRLGDEHTLTVRSSADDHERVVRAYRQLAAQLRAQGMSEAADRLSDRAQVRQRKLLFRRMLADWRRPWRLPGDLLRWLFSWFLALLAGYGYHPGRSVFWYLATIAGFTFLYMQATHGWVPFGLPAPSQLAPLPWYEALILSVSSFHGRGFFQPLESLGDPIAALAAIEAVIGLLIEISFIATFTQRFFGNT
jgi:pentapeptide repeat protein